MDYSKYQPELSDDGLIAKIAVQASELDRLNKELARLEKEEGQVTAQLKNISEVILPTLMDEANGTTRWEGNGLSLKLEETITGSCPVPSTRDPELVRRRSRLFKWLDDHGYGKIINRELKLVFDRDDEATARAIEADLKSQNLNVARNYGIHPQTLSKFVRDCLKEGIDIPEDVFGVNRRRVAKLEKK